MRLRRGHRPKASLVGWCCYQPAQPNQQDRLSYHLVAGSVTDRVLIRQLQYLHRRLRRPFVLVWDHLASHHSRRMRSFAAGHDWLHLEYLPAYAPDLNPVEGMWAQLKNGVLANLGARTLDELTATARRGLRRIQRRPDLLTSFLIHTGLEWNPQTSS